MTTMIHSHVPACDTGWCPTLDAPDTREAWEARVFGPVEVIDMYPPTADDEPRSHPLRRVLIMVAAAAATVATTMIMAAGPASAAEPSALCRDGSLSYSASRSGTCSGHGGVAEWRAGAPAKRARSAPVAPVAPAPAPGGWDCRTSGNWVCGPGQAWAPGYYVNYGYGPTLVAPWAS